MILSRGAAGFKAGTGRAGAGFRRSPIPSHPEIAGFEAGLTLDRLEFGVGTGDWVRTNVVAGEVQVEIAIEASRR